MPNKKPQHTADQPISISTQVLTPKVVDDIKPRKVKHRSTTSHGVDITFVFDTTGSMASKIDALLGTCKQLVHDLDNQGLDYRAAIVTFGDLTVPGDTIKATGYTDSLHTFEQMVAKAPRNSGGSNYGESSLEAIDKAITNCKNRGRSEAVQVFILITDEPALGGDIAAARRTQMLRQEEILTFCISPPELYFKSMATQTGGEWMQISADAGMKSIQQKLLKIATRITQVIAKVYDPQVGDGNVKQYLALNPPT